MTKKKEKNEKNKAHKEELLKELNNVNKDVKEELKIIDTVEAKIKNINDNIFLGYHDLKLLKLDLKNKEIEVQEKKAFNVLSSRKINNVVNKHILKCYENYLNNITENEINILKYSEELQKEKEDQISNKDYDKLKNLTDIEHMNKLKTIIFSQNNMINDMNNNFNKTIKQIRNNYIEKINIQKNVLEKKRLENILKMQKKNNENIKNILSDHNEKVLNLQNYFRLILNDQLEMIQELQAEKLNKKNSYFLKVKQLEDLKKNISIHKKKHENINKDVTSLEKNTKDYVKLKEDYKKILEKKKKQSKILENLKFDTDVKKMLYKNLSNEYEKLYNEQKMKLYVYLQKLLIIF